MTMTNDETTSLSELAASLRQNFDQAFAQAPAGAGAPTQAFLAIQIGGDSYALRLRDVSGLFADKKIVPLPSQSPDLLGIASFRGALIPVYDLRILLGYPAGAAPRWLVLVAQAAPISLAFDQLDGYLDLLPEAIAPAAGAEQKRQYLAETLNAAGVIRPVVSVTSIVETIRRRTQSGSPRAER